jgi:nucleotide-binding universal stress UspA family protein
MKVLLAVDGSDCSERAAEVVMSQLPRATSDIRVLHVDEWPKDLPPSMAFAEGPAAAQAVLASHERRRIDAEALVSRHAGTLRAAGLRASTVVRSGDARHGVLECAAEWGADLIVLGSHGRTGVNRFLLGSVSESVARHAPCSVLIVRASPAGA